MFLINRLFSVITTRIGAGGDIRRKTMNTSMLEKVGKMGVVHIIGGKKYNPYEYFQTDIGLELDSFDFKKNIRPLMKNEIITVEKTDLEYIDLKEETSINEIQKILPSFEDVNHFLCKLAWMIDVQDGGEEGRLLTTFDPENIFFVKGTNDDIFVVSVFWFEDHGKDIDDEPAHIAEWVCGAKLPRNMSGKFPKGTRVFFPTT